MSAPEWNILDRTVTIVKTLAAERSFTASQGERVRSVTPAAVKFVKVVEGGNQIRSSTGVSNIILPGILICSLPVESLLNAGLNCADDEAHRISIQIIDSSGGPQGNQRPLRTYMDWMDLIRTELLTIPNPFLQDADVEVYDPFVVHIIKRLPAEAQSLVRHDQQVAMLNFQVMVRHHRTL